MRSMNEDRKGIFDESADIIFKKVYEKIIYRYKINFIEIGNDEDHILFLVQIVPTLCITKMVITIKSITAREIIKFIKESL